MKIICLLCAIVFSTTSLAGILIEPQIGYLVSSKFKGTANISTANSVGTLDDDHKATGIEVGGRFGYQALGFMTGVSYGKISGDITDNTDGTKGDYKITNTGVFIGYSAPILLRAWLAYNFSSKGYYDGDAVKGKSTEIGLGFTSLPLVSLNFIYRQYDLSEITIQGTKYNSTGFKPKEMVIALSVPFNLF